MQSSLAMPYLVFMKKLPWIIVAILGGLVIWLSVRDVDVPTLLKSVRENVVLFSAVVAVGSLVVATTSFVINRISSRKEATLKAWSDWSDVTLKARLQLTSTFGPKNITDEQGEALAQIDRTLADKNGNLLDEKEKRKTIDSVLTILNGLERIAVGIHHGVYRYDVVASIGGTTVVRAYKRLLPYIDSRRNFPDPELRQVKVYVYLEDLVDKLEKKAQIDKSLIRAHHRS